MAHPLECPSCNFTTRISDELFARKVSGRRVKIPCKGCRKPLVVDATTSELRVASFTRPQVSGVSSPPTCGKPSDRSVSVPLPRSGRDARPLASFAPMGVAPPLVEEELPTLRRNEVPSDEAFLSPAVGSEAPPTSWPYSVAPLTGNDSLAALLAPASRRAHRGKFAALVLLAACVAWALAWGAPRHSDVITEPRPEPGPVSALAPSHAPASESAPSADASADASAHAAAHAKLPAVRAQALPVKSEMQPAPEVQLSGPEATDAVEAGSSSLGPRVVEEAAEPGLEVQPLPFDRSAAAAALQVAEGEAATCRGAGDPSGTARVVVTFAPSGRVTSATLSGPPFAGTSTGGCIASRFRAARVPQFEGGFVTVTKTVVIQ